MFLSKRAVTKVQALIVIVIVVVVALVGIGFTGFGPQPVQTSTTNSATQSAGHTDTLSIDEWMWPLDDLNELWSVGLAPWPDPLAYTVYQPLVMPNFTAEWQQGNIQFLPGLATWTVSPDGKVYTFSLKQNVKFSTGDPFNAYQMWAEMYGFYYLSGNSSAWLENYNLLDMSPVNFGPATIDLITKSGVINPSQDLLKLMMDSSWPIYVTDQYTIVFRLTNSFVWFPGVFVCFEGFALDTQWVLENGGFGTPGSINTYFNQHPIPGTGPYMVTQVIQNSLVGFDQNPNYWGANLTADEIAQQPVFDPGHVKHVIVYFKQDDLARYTDLSTGAVQIAAIQAPDWNLVTGNPQTYSYLKNPTWTGEVALLGLNTNLYPTNVREVRQAIVHAINYTQLYRTAYLGSMTPYMGPEYPAYKDFYDLGNHPPYEYDVTLAKQYLAQAEAKYPNLTSSMPTFTLRTLTGTYAGINGAQVIQADLAQIGITVNIQVLQTSAYWAPYGNWQTNVANAAEIGQLSFVNGGSAWGPNALTPADYWLAFVSGKSLWGNWAGYSNPIVQKGVDAFTSGASITQIQSLVKDAQDQIYEDAPYAWIGTFGLWGVAGGSLVWKNGVISSFYVDPLWGGKSTAPIFNTIIFSTSSQFAQLVSGIPATMIQSSLAMSTSAASVHQPTRFDP
jgi:peptide/nickel transport system substrate-binding protein